MAAAPTASDARKKLDEINALIATHGSVVKAANASGITEAALRGQRKRAEASLIRAG